MRRRIVLFFTVAVGVTLVSASAAMAATVAVDGGSKYTKKTSVTVTYQADLADEYYRISNSPSFTSADVWNDIDFPGEANDVTWELASTQGTETVYMEFAITPDDPSPTSASDFIVLDTVGPRCIAYPGTVRYKTVVGVPFRVTDNFSPKVHVWMRVKKGDATKRVLIRGALLATGSWQRIWNVNLPRARYRIVVTAEDLAGNRESRVGYAWMTVK